MGHRTRASPTTKAERQARGAIRIEISDPFARSGSATAVLPGPDEEINVQVKVTPTGRVTGRFRMPDPGHTPIPYGTVTLKAGGKVVGQTTALGSGDVGRFSFDYVLFEKPEGVLYAKKSYEREEGLFRSPSGRIEIYCEALEKVGFDPLPTFLEPERGPKRGKKEFLEQYPLILSTGSRNLYYTHSQHRNVEALRKMYPEPMAEISPVSAQRFGIKDVSVAMGTFITVVLPLPKEQTEDYPAHDDQEN